MEDHGQKAKLLFRQGYSCSQAVLGAFAEELGIDFEMAMKLSSSFGGGMGSLREVCGAVTGMFMVAGIKYGYDRPHDRPGKVSHYKRIQKLAGKFREENHSIICRELLGIKPEGENLVPRERTDEYYKKRPCADLVENAARIMEEYIREHEAETAGNHEALSSDRAVIHD